jgi:Glycosyl hydrolases family 2, TIM barrel domain/Glycosyl hydrolases family 2, sugar binding domain/Glycosyl hydrolases family 2/Beta galactosidase small chain
MVNQMKKILLHLFFTLLSLSAFTQETTIQYLSGTDNKHTVLWDFYCTGGRNSGRWTKIPVPSNWEMQGFGTLNYGHDSVKSNEQGIYKFHFFSDQPKDKEVFLVFEGSMTDTRVSVNGQLVGPVHQGGFYRFKYDITGLLHSGKQNILEITVDKNSENKSVNDAERRNSDFWVFGGIFRPVYLEIVPKTFIDRIAIDAKADGSLRLDVYPKNCSGNEFVQVQVQQLNGKPVGEPFIRVAGNDEKVQLEKHFDSPRLWSAEFPNLYQLLVSIRDNHGIVHQIRKKFGFRTIEMRKNDGLYINDSKIVMKGCNRHSFWPTTGRTLNHEIQLMDVSLIKEMNMNAVRMSHYPPDQDFLDVCDSLGLYVLDELTGWQARYDTIVGRKLVKELVVRDVNHPSIIFWDNGNEGGWNRGLDSDYALYDPQQRVVLHPWEKFNGTDTKHYPDYNYIVQSVHSGQDVFFPTEFMHGLYDGGAGAGLDDFWTLMLKHPHGAGGFIWAFLDESVYRADKNGSFDGDGNHAPDGIVGPHREKEASFFAIKEIWSPVFFNLDSLPENFNGRIPVENRYSFTNLNQCSFRWKLVDFPSPDNLKTEAEIVSSGKIIPYNLGPGQQGILQLPLPKSWYSAQALYLTAVGPDHKEIFTWSWPILMPRVPISKNASLISKSTIKIKDSDNQLNIRCGDIDYFFNKNNGCLQKVIKASGSIPLSEGPLLAGMDLVLKKFVYYPNGKQYIVETNYDGPAVFHAKWTFVAGQKVRLDYEYNQEGDAEFIGVAFRFPKDKITSMKWLGRGPYRVWKNRLKGQEFAVWQKSYNNTVTGENWNYPEFKGYHAEVNWVRLNCPKFSFTIYAANPNIFLALLRPDKEKAALKNNNVEPAFPNAEIGFLDSIPAIGTKFQAAKVMGPQSQINHANGKEIRRTFWFDFVH